jgi:hypothetical protein
MREFFEATPAAGEEAFLLLYIGRVEKALVEASSDEDGLKVGIDDELSEGGVAADVAFASGVERFGIDLADDVAEVEIALPDVLDICAAKVAEIALFAAGHWGLTLL